MTIEPQLDSTSHLVSHLLREIESALRDVLEPKSETNARSTKKKGNDTHRNEILAVLEALGIPENEKVSAEWLKLASGREGYSLHSRAHRDDLAKPRPIDQDFSQFWDIMETILDVVLDKFESRYLAYHRTLDNLLSLSSPTAADIKTLRLNVPNNLVAFGYFFGNLNNPAWLDPLSADDFFGHPPEPEYEREKDRVNFPRWPESRYLARMAPLSPDKVLEICLHIPATDNIRIHEDLADVALGLPAELSARLVPLAVDWLKSPYQLGLPEKLGALVAHLAEGRQIEQALLLARELLTILPDPRTMGKGDKIPTFFSLDPQTRIEGWHYRRIINHQLPALLDAAGEKLLALLCGLLQDAACLSLQPGDVGPEDRSYIWRPAIEHDSRRGDFKDTLVSSVRDTAIRLAQEPPGRIPSLVESLESRPWHIFHRIALHLLRHFPETTGDLIAERLTNKDYFDELAFRHEYFLLIRDCFASLTKDQQMRILGWIDAGTNLERLKDWHESFVGRPPTEEEIERYGKSWKLERLAPIRDELPDNWRRFYVELVTELGEPRDPEYVYPPPSVTSADVSIPKKSVDLQSMSVDEIVSFLRTWSPPDDAFDQSPEGLRSASFA